MTLDHTLTWEIARVGGMLAYVLVTASVALGLLLSLKATSENWPRFITNELHRFVTLVALVFTGLHTLAVLLDPFTGFSLNEVFLPLTSHYRPLWIAMGIVSAYLLVAVWASEYVRKRRRLCLVATVPLPCLRRVSAGDAAWPRNRQRLGAALGARPVRGLRRAGHAPSRRTHRAGNPAEDW